MQTEKKIYKEYALNGWPSWIILDVDGKEIGRTSGCPASMDIMNRKINELNSHLEKYDSLKSMKEKADYLFSKSAKFDYWAMGHIRSALIHYEDAFQTDSSLEEIVSYLRSQLTQLQARSRIEYSRAIKKYDAFINSFPDSKHVAQAKLGIAQLTVYTSKKKGIVLLEEWLKEYPEHESANMTENQIKNLKASKR